LKLVPERYRDWYHLNPLVDIIDGYRRVLLFQQTPDWERLGYNAGVAIVALVLGYWYFKTVELKLADIA
jgi:lipopolysaccharide transport system permease protein